MNPIWSFFRVLGYIIKARLHFPKQRIGETYIMEDGKDFTVFRHAVIRGTSGGQSSVVFKVRFLLANMTPQRNKLFSFIPIPFFIGLPGFRAKLWMIDEKYGYFQGLYEWDNLLNAENYSQSFAMRFMKKRSVPGSVHYEILTDRHLEDYVDTLECSWEGEENVI